jgi:hypothetical protein
MAAEIATMKAAMGNGTVADWPRLFRREEAPADARSRRARCGQGPMAQPAQPR